MSVLTAITAVSVGLAIIVAFAAGVLFGAHLQRQVGLGRDIRLKRGGKSWVESDVESDGKGYESPYKGHRL